MIASKTPLRITLMGAGDLPAFCEKHQGTIISFAVPLYCYVFASAAFGSEFVIKYSECERTKTPDQIRHPLIRAALYRMNQAAPLEIACMADVPTNGTGLGGSSAFTVGLLKAIHRTQTPEDCTTKIDNMTVAQMASVIEILDLKQPIGRHDQYACAVGGANCWKFNGNEVVRQPIRNMPFLIGDRGFLVYTGERIEDSNGLLKKQIDSSKFEEANLQMAYIASRCLSKLFDNNITEMSVAMNKCWEIKRSIHPQIVTPLINEIYERAMLAGASAGRLCGSGGGGFMFFLVEVHAQRRFRKALDGLKILRATVEKEGARAYTIGV